MPIVSERSADPFFLNFGEGLLKIKTSLALIFFKLSCCQMYLFLTAYMYF